MEQKLIKELNKLNAKAFKDEYDMERIQEIEEQLEELQDMSYESLLEISE